MPRHERAASVAKRSGLALQQRHTHGESCRDLPATVKVRRKVLGERNPEDTNSILKFPMPNSLFTKRGSGSSVADIRPFGSWPNHHLIFAAGIGGGIRTPLKTGSSDFSRLTKQIETSQQRFESGPGDSITLKDLFIGAVSDLMRNSPTVNRNHPRRRSVLDQAVAIADSEAIRCFVERIARQMVVRNRVLEMNLLTVAGSRVPAFLRRRRLVRALE